jgi:hypothetical protein
MTYNKPEVVAVEKSIGAIQKVDKFSTDSHDSPLGQPIVYSTTNAYEADE